MTTREVNEQLLKLLEEKRNRQQYNFINYLFPDEDITDYPFVPNSFIPARYKYPKQLEFFAVGADYMFRILMGPNGCGKTVNGASEMFYHMSGLYPAWWTGRKFDQPIVAWIAGPTAKTVKDGAQTILLGPEADPGSGIIPRHLIKDKHTKPGVGGAIESFMVPHVSGGMSIATFKAYSDAVDTYSGAKIKVVWLDEEPPLKIYTECVARVMRTEGLLMLTFTPDNGMSDTILNWFPDGEFQTGPNTAGRYCVKLNMDDDVPHLTKVQKKRFYDELPPYSREAKYYGNPSAGVGRIYPINREDIIFDISDKVPDMTWPRAYGMDPGWIKTAVVWIAYEKTTDTIYVYDTYYKGQDNAAVHASAIKARGDWMYGVIDKAAKQNSSVVASENALDVYTNLGLNLVLSQFGREVEAGIAEVWNRLSTGRLKIASHLQDILKELGAYRRNEEGEIVQPSVSLSAIRHDLLDALRYIVRNFQSLVQVKPDLFDEPRKYAVRERSDVSGY